MHVLLVNYRVLEEVTANGTVSDPSMFVSKYPQDPSFVMVKLVKGKSTVFLRTKRESTSSRCYYGSPLDIKVPAMGKRSWKLSNGKLSHLGILTECLHLPSPSLSDALYSGLMAF